MPAVPTQGEEFAKFLHHLRAAEDSAYMLNHLTRAQGTAKDKALADGWFAVGELLKRMVHQTTQLAKGHLQ